MIDSTTLCQLLKKYDCCRIGYYDGEEVYMVPLNFGYAQEGDHVVLYFHGAKKGRRYDLAHSHPKVGFELDSDHQLIDGPRAVNYTYRFKSIIGNGVLQLVEEASEKTKAMQAIMCHYTGRPDWAIEQRVLNNTAIYRLDITKISYRQK